MFETQFIKKENVFSNTSLLEYFHTYRRNIISKQVGIIDKSAIKFSLGITYSCLSGFPEWYRYRGSGGVVVQRTP